MKNIQEYRRIYKAILDALDGAYLDRAALIKAAVDSSDLTEEEKAEQKNLREEYLAEVRKALKG